MFRIIGDYSPAILIPRILDFLETVWVHPWLECCLILFVYRMFLCHVFHLEYASGLFFLYPLQVACLYEEVIWKYYNVFVVVFSFVTLSPSVCLT